MLSVYTFEYVFKSFSFWLWFSPTQNNSNPTVQIVIVSIPFNNKKVL